jgi:hypothetical protein
MKILLYLLEFLLILLVKIITEIIYLTQIISVSFTIKTISQEILLLYIRLMIAKKLYNYNFVPYALFIYNIYIIFV